MQLTEDSFRALARSSPWRFRTLHFTFRNEPDERSAVEAWLRRPGWLKVRRPDGTERTETGLPYTRSELRVFVPDGAEYTPPPQPEWVTPDRIVPPYREDGLVAQRPEWPEAHVSYDDPMYGSYDWVATLDPVELSRGVRLADLREDVHHGRPVWRARVWPEGDYDPRCTCCALLASEAIDREEWGEERWNPDGDWVYPDGSEVALDVETGIVVHAEQVGGSLPYAGFIDVEILEVDAEV